jgi:hypothetical protein
VRPTDWLDERFSRTFGEALSLRVEIPTTRRSWLCLDLRASDEHHQSVNDDLYKRPARPLQSMAVVVLLLCLVLVAMLAGSPADLNPVPAHTLYDWSL